jgi:hypothetical protein
MSAGETRKLSEYNRVKINVKVEVNVNPTPRKRVLNSTIDGNGELASRPNPRAGLNGVV